MAYATFEEMSYLRPGGIDLDDRLRAEALLEEASSLVDEEAGPLKTAEWAVPEAAIPPAIKSVTIQVALRVFDNPSSVSMEQATGYMYQRPVAYVTGLELTKSEVKRVRRAAGKATAYSVRTPAGMDETTMSTALATDEV